MFKKKDKSSSNTKLQEKKNSTPLSQEILEALQEKNLYDDHGNVILGNRKYRPKF